MELQTLPFGVGKNGWVAPVHAQERTSSTYLTRFSKQFLSGSRLCPAPIRLVDRGRGQEPRQPSFRENPSRQFIERAGYFIPDAKAGRRSVR